LQTCQAKRLLLLRSSRLRHLTHLLRVRLCKIWHTALPLLLQSLLLSRLLGHLTHLLPIRLCKTGHTTLRLLKLLSKHGSLLFR
jgi:hypothetical protein